MFGVSKDFSNNQDRKCWMKFCLIHEMLAPFTPICSTGSWPPWLRQILPHFISLYRKLMYLCTLLSEVKWYNIFHKQIQTRNYLFRDMKCGSICLSHGGQLPLLHRRKGNQHFMNQAKFHSKFPILLLL